MVINVEQFISAVLENAARIRRYQKGGTGADGGCDCVGLLIGALLLAKVKYAGIHGSNYFARKWTEDLKKISSTSELSRGDIVFKSLMPGEQGYDLPERYAGSSWKNDFYHVGVVLIPSPLKIAHCSSGGMHYDTKLGKWSYAGKCKNVRCTTGVDLAEITRAVVDVPNNGTLNVRARPSTNADKVDVIREGTEVDVLATGGGWSKIRYPMEGYVMSEYLKPREEHVENV